MATSSFSRTQPQEEAVSSGVNATNTNPFATKTLSSANEQAKRQRVELVQSNSHPAKQSHQAAAIVGSTAGFKTDGGEDGPPPLADFDGNVIQPPPEEQRKVI